MRFVKTYLLFFGVNKQGTEQVETGDFKTRLREIITTIIKTIDWYWYHILRKAFWFINLTFDIFQRNLFHNKITVNPLINDLEGGVY